MGDLQHQLIVYDRDETSGAECVADIIRGEDLVPLFRTAYRAQRRIKGVTRCHLDYHIGGDQRAQLDLRLIFRGSQTVSESIYIREELVRVIDMLHGII